MKKILQSIALLFAAHVVAQPTIQNVNLQYNQEVYLYSLNTPIEMNFPLSGNQTWDFSTANDTVLTAIVNLANPSTFPHINEFPMANVGQVIYNPQLPLPLVYFYGRITNDSLYTMGIRSSIIPEMNYNYINPETSYKFPFNLGETVIDYHQIDTANSVVEGEKNRYVAYGTITTIFGTFNDAVLIRDANLNAGGEETSVSYKFISATTLQNIMDIDSTDGEANVVNLSSLTSLFQDKLHKQYNLNVWPNPTNSNATISLNLQNKSNVSVEIVSVAGKIERTNIFKDTFEGQLNIPVNLENFSDGIYFVKITAGNDLLIKKVIKN